MGSNHGLQKRGKVNLRINILLACFVLLVSCAYPSPLIQESPGVPSDPISPTNLPNTTLETPQSVALEPTSLGTPIAMPSSQVTPEEGNSISTEIINPPTQYDLDAILDYLQHSLSVTETINYVNNTPEALVDLILVVEPNRRQAAFRLASLSWAGGDSIGEYNLERDQLHIPLPQPLASGDGLSIIIHYALEIPEISPTSDHNRP